MRGPWSRKTPRRVSIAPVVDKQAVQELRKAKLVSIVIASEKTNVKGVGS